MKNSTYIINNYKLSTIPRMKLLFGFTSLKSIDESEEVTNALAVIQRQPGFKSYIQEVLFDLIESEFKMTDVKHFVDNLS